jgi:pimeloyl-ACP methyl ester carboxylesterase
VQRFEEAVEEARLRYTVPGYTTAYVRTLRSLVLTFLRAYLPGPASLWRVAARITAPTLVIGGQRDLLVDVRVAAQVGRTIPDSRLLLLPDIGHVAQMEDPRTVARAFLGMLDELAAASPVRVRGAGNTRRRQRDVPVRGGIVVAGEVAG